jgi:hypothetical protein
MQQTILIVCYNGATESPIGSRYLLIISSDGQKPEFFPTQHHVTNILQPAPKKGL